MPRSATNIRTQSTTNISKVTQRHPAKTVCPDRDLAGQSKERSVLWSSAFPLWRLRRGMIQRERDFIEIQNEMLKRVEKEIK